MQESRRTFLKAAGAATAAALVAPHVARAATFPSGPVSLMVPFSPGGGADRSMRLMAPFLSKELGVPVTIENIDGGGGWLGWSEMAKWDPEKDDHKLGCINLPHLFSYMDPRMKRTETLESFNILCWHSYDPCIWAVRENDERFLNLKQFLDYVEKNPDQIVISSTGVGSDDHMGIAYAEKFLPNFKVRKVYSNGDNKKIQEVIGSVTDCVAGNVGYYVPFMLEAQLRPICVLHDERWSELPSVPTFKEVTGKENVSYAGRTVGAAKGLPEEKNKVYLDALRRTIANPEYIIQELASKNVLMFLEGDALQARLKSSADRVASIKFWESE
ncbi:tripartite tricarboxylate transporter substrate binding protein [Propylenella binzhouense]|uniref:Tripartite tricarboxylate transporter substrate binding protein n=1 Tax=Propylenella binzhouense TaxID=2555902 RepID=A0A964T7U8_9HYPH|nr:tripartite tricarboxylate transporter substrate binding protein [Propylenella binzhouense]MYZ50113.1 tripartite tricarboxylate transporter substrate binding protein [Propylenella binzhouense]